MKTGIIKFNVHKRGRQHRGQERKFDAVALADVVNGGEVQERVKNRDLVGYFGHWPRVMFGMNPGEGGIYDGRQITLEPAITTTVLRASLDGTIEHEAEFLDTAPGRTAKRLFSSKAGGFSSAINCREIAGKDVPVGFYGFDYVMEPNFTENRGYALDGVFDGIYDGVQAGSQSQGGLVLDSAMRESQATIKVLDGLYTALQGDYDRLAGALARTQQENEELVRLFARDPQATAAHAKQVLARLDDAADPVRGLRKASPDSTLLRMAREFKAMPLEGREAPKGDDKPGDAGIVRQLTTAVSGIFGIR